MKKIQNELEKFLFWFSQLEEIPLKTRKDFFAHVLAEGGLDQKAQKFIDDTLEVLEKRNQKKATVLQQKINLIEGALKIQANPKRNLKERVVIGVTNWMNEKIDNFKVMFQAKEKAKAKKEEFAEETENQLLVDRLKASLN